MAEQKEQSSFRVTYYASTGRAVPLRQAAALGGISFEDKFITKEQQNQQKANGLRRWSGPPEITILDKDGKDVVTIGQSNACLRYIGNISGTYPKSFVQRALVDEVLDSSEDLLGVAGKVAFNPDEDAKAKAAKELVKADGSLAYWLNKFESRLEENEKRGNKNGFFVGDSITIADLKYVISQNDQHSCIMYPNDRFTAVFIYAGMITGAMELVKGYKRISALLEAVPKNEKIKAFAEVFDKNTAAAKEGKGMEFKYEGKAVPSDL